MAIYKALIRLLNALAEKVEIESAIYIMQIQAEQKAARKKPTKKPPDDDYAQGQYL